jgi:hypothetical protein
MTQQERIRAAYEELRHAEMAKRGAEEYLIDAESDVDACRKRLEVLLKSVPTPVE